MTAPPCTLRPAFVQAELARLGLGEWAFIRECSRADRCSVNRCPLDPLVGLRFADPSDLEKRCTVSRPDRERFFSRLTPQMQALLPYGGLFKAEWERREAGRRLQARLTPEQREQQAATLRAHRAAPFGAVTSTATKTTAVGSTPDTSQARGTAKAGATGGDAA
jgi:hypothetical protein